jgi:hypothetical protein
MAVANQRILSLTKSVSPFGESKHRTDASIDLEIALARVLAPHVEDQFPIYIAPTGALWNPTPSCHYPS